MSIYTKDQMQVRYGYESNRLYVTPCMGITLPGEVCIICSTPISESQEFPISLSSTKEFIGDLCTECGGSSAKEFTRLCKDYGHIAWSHSNVAMEEEDLQAVSMSQQEYMKRINNGTEPGHAGIYYLWHPSDSPAGVCIFAITNLPGRMTEKALLGTLLISGIANEGDFLRPIGDKPQRGIEISWRFVLKALETRYESVE